VLSEPTATSPPAVGMDIDLSNIESAIANAADVRELMYPFPPGVCLAPLDIDPAPAHPRREEGAAPVDKAMTEHNWQAEVSDGWADCGRWGALVCAGFCTLLHLPALALQSSWPELIDKLFSTRPDPEDVQGARWSSLMATVVCLVLNLLCLAVGAAGRRGFLPLMLGLCGCLLVLVSPLYFLAGEYDYLEGTAESRYGQDVVVLLGNVVGLSILLVPLLGSPSAHSRSQNMFLSTHTPHTHDGSLPPSLSLSLYLKPEWGMCVQAASAWNASLDRMLALHWAEPGRSGNGVHQRLSGRDLDDHCEVASPEPPDPRWP
jgi:hypothetical protein